MPFPDDLTPQDLLPRLPPGADPVPVASREGRALRSTLARGRVHLILRELGYAISRGHRGRNQSEIFDHFNGAIRQHTGRSVIYRLGSELIVHARTADMIQISRDRVADIVERLAITSLCEVGCGTGSFLLYLAQRFPHITCSGFELTPFGTELARQAGADVQCASAFALPVRDASYDLVLTFSALEQMQLGLDRALSEIRRVARRYVLFHEPFFDANGLSEWLYLWSRNYFRAHSNQLRAYGLEPIRVWTGIPRKPTFSYAIVLAEVSGRGAKRNSLYFDWPWMPTGRSIK